MKKRLLIALILLLLLSTYSIQNNISFFTNLNIKKITIKNNNIIKEVQIKTQLSFLYEKNIFFINTRKIESKLAELDFIDSYKIKKIYPNELNIKIYEKKPIAIIHNKKEKNFYTDKGEIISYIDLNKFKDLPLVYGDHKNFTLFYKTLQNINFPINEIDKFYLFEAKRWDIVTNKNQTIKLPIKNYKESLKNFNKIKEQRNFERYKTFDYRINEQLILK